MLGLTPRTSDSGVHLAFQSRPGSLDLPASLSPSLPILGYDWHTQPSTMNSPACVCVCEGGYAALPPEALFCTITDIFIIHSFCTFDLLTGAPGSSLFILLPPWLLPISPAQSGHVYLGLPQISIALSMLSAISVTSVLLHHT